MSATNGDYSHAAPYPRFDGTQPCAGEDPEVFFPTSFSRNNAFSIHRAREACAACPFRRPCLAYALTHDVHGIWGGTSRNERVELRREHGITAEPVGLPDAVLKQIDIDAMDRGGGFLRRHRPRAGDNAAHRPPSTRS